MITTLMAESEELKSLLKRMKNDSEKVGLKCNIQKTNIMASVPITSWQIDGKKWKQWQILFSWSPKSLWMVTAAMKLKDTYSLEEKLNSVLKSRNITLSTKVCIVKAMGSLVVKYRCESWTFKQSEHQRIDAFELWCWRRLLRVPWTARRSNQSIRKAISPGWSLEGLMLKLKLQYCGHLMWRADSDAGKG